MIDKEKDVRSGQWFRALEQMRRDLPRLDFIYVDTYWENGWPAARTAQKINHLGLPMYSEGSTSNSCAGYPAKSPSSAMGSAW